MRRAFGAIAAGVVVGAILTPGSATAAQTTTVSVNLAPSQWRLAHIDHSTEFRGGISPQHPADTRVKLQELRSGSWQTIAKNTSINGTQYVIRTPVLKSYRYHYYRVCVPATGKFAGDCTYKLHAIAGRTVWMSSLTPAAHTGPLSTGALTVNYIEHKHSLRWPGSASSGSVTYNVHGKCAMGFAGIGVEDSAVDGNVTFSLYIDGVKKYGATIGAGPYYNDNLITAHKDVFRFTAVRSGTAGEQPSQHYGFGAVSAFCAIPP